MSKNTPGAKGKALRKENAIKKAKRKKLIITGICGLTAVIVLFFVIRSIIKQNSVETYSDGSQTVQLFSDGKFTASLMHNTKKDGTYTRTVDGSVTVVSFNTGGVVAVGRIENGALYFPEEWEDGHSHGNMLPRK